jgi:AcrR family transcriptional regulator
MVGSRTTAEERSVTDPDPTSEAPDDRLRGYLLDHTLRVLLRDGYRRFSMNAVATSAKASKETLYRHFGDKTGLLLAALARSAALIGPLLHVGLESATTRHDRLRQLGLNYLHGCYMPEALALQRIAYADGEHGLGPLFAEEITERAVAVVEDEFEALGSDQPRRDAEVYLGMIQGKLHERIMLGSEIDDLEQQLEAQVDHALTVMTAYLDSVERTRQG